MATAVPFTRSVASGATLYAGRFPDGLVRGDAVLDSVAALGGVGVNVSAISGGAVLDGVGAGGDLQGLVTWGQGSDAGTFSAGVWTPGRNSGGLVNQVSWDLVPTGQFVRIAGTEMSTLTAAIVAANLQWDSASLNWAGYTQSWAGWAVDVIGLRVWAFSGGHSDGNNNGLYRFDALKMAWAIEQMPTDRGQQNSEYGASQGTRNAAADSATYTKYAGGTLGYINDLWYDQFLVNNQPTARHTYASLLYDSSRDRIYMAVRRWWEFNRSTGLWDYRRIFNDNPHTSGLPEYMDGEHAEATWDEVTGEALFSSAGSLGVNRSLSYRPSTGAWTGTYYAPWSGWGNVASARFGRTWTGVAVPYSTNSPGKYWKYSLDSRSVLQSGDFQYGGGLTLADFVGVNDYYDGASLAWIEPFGKYLMVTQNQNRAMKFFWVDPSTTPWTCSPAVITNAPTNLAALLNRRMVVMPALNALLLQDLGHQQMYLFKF